MVEMKQMGFMLIILLVSVSAVYEFASSEDSSGNPVFPALSTALGISSISPLGSSTLQQQVSDVDIASGDDIETTVRENPLAFALGLLNTALSMFVIFLPLLFGWVALIDAIFVSIGIPGMSIVFIGPIAVIEILTIIYFLIDIVLAARRLF